MAKRNIRLFPDAVLRSKAHKVKRFNAQLLALIDDMLETMSLQRHGIGLAAPQIGVSKQVAIVDVSSRVPNARRLILINPVIIHSGDETISREGCMSIPEYTAYLKRFREIRIRWQDQYGIYHEKEFRGIEAICIQHEMDHLNGNLFIDRVSCLKTDMIPRTYGQIKGKKK